MDIERKVIVKQNIKYLVCYLHPRYVEDTKVSVNGAEFEDASDENMPESLYRKFDTIETEKTRFIKNFEGEKLVKFVIDVDKGIIKNWPLGIAMQIHWKVVDEGLYQYLDENNDIIWEFDGYVPDELAVVDTGYGDYVIMDVNENGVIDNWLEQAHWRIRQTIKSVFLDV